MSLLAGAEPRRLHSLTAPLYATLALMNAAPPRTTCQEQLTLKTQPSALITP
jgi:hypothetical protein